MRTHAYEAGYQIAKDLYDPRTSLGQRVERELRQQELEKLRSDREWLRKERTETNDKLRESMAGLAVICSTLASFLTEEKFGIILLICTVFFLIWLLSRLSLALFRSVATE